MTDQKRAKAAVEWIAGYLSSGGFFNPEYMDHQKVSDFLIEQRELLRPIAAGTHVIVQKEHLDELVKAIEAASKAHIALHPLWDAIIHAVTYFRATDVIAASQEGE